MKTSPVFHYVSQCCNSVATKPACLKVKAEAPKGKFKADKQKAPEFASLGKWRCGSCKKVTKVSRVKATSVAVAEPIQGQFDNDTHILASVIGVAVTSLGAL